MWPLNKRCQRLAQTFSQHLVTKEQYLIVYLYLYKTRGHPTSARPTVSTPLRSASRSPHVNARLAASLTLLATVCWNLNASIMAQFPSFDNNNLFVANLMEINSQSSFLVQTCILIQKDYTSCIDFAFKVGCLQTNIHFVKKPLFELRCDLKTEIYT